MKKRIGHKKYYKENSLIGYGHKPGTKIEMSDKVYVIGNDGEYRFVNYKKVIKK